MKVLLIAYACEPNSGSEPGVGWNTVMNLAKLNPMVDFTVITRSNNKKTIEENNFLSNVRFLYNDVGSLLYLKRRFNPIRTYYYFWSIFTSYKFREIAVDYDVVHHITFVNDWLPSPISLLKKGANTKFIWGPLGSNEAIPLRHISSVKQRLKELLRRFIPKVIISVDPFYKKTISKADIILGINESVKAKFSNYSHKYEHMHSICISTDYLNDLEKKAKTGKFTFISVGNLIQIKNFNLTLIAFKKFLDTRLDKKSFQLVIIGDGQLRAELVDLANSLSIEENVQFLGKLNYSEVKNHYRNADAFVFPTFEASGMVILEAMYSRLPVVAVDTGGPAFFTSETNKKFLASKNNTTDEICTEMSKFMSKLVDEKEFLKQLGNENSEHVLSNFTWESKVNKYMNYYGSSTSE